MQIRLVLCRRKAAYATLAVFVLFYFVISNTVASHVIEMALKNIAKKNFSVVASLLKDNS